MVAEFLDGLKISDEDRAKLAAFGANTAFALLSIRKASKDAFDDYIGQDRADIVTEQLESLISDDQRESLRKPTRPAGKLGARMDPRPGKDRS